MLLCARILPCTRWDLATLSTASSAAAASAEEQVERRNSAHMPLHARTHLHFEAKSVAHFVPGTNFADSAHFLLQQCPRLQNDLSACRKMHAVSVSMGLDGHAFVADHLVRAFASSGSLLEAYMVFYKAEKGSLFSWNAIISAHADIGEWEMACVMYHQLWQEGINPDKCTFFAVLRTCSANRAIEQGRLIHEHTVRCMLASVEVLAITLIDMYTKCGYLEDARKVFDTCPNQNVVTWNVMISGYAQAGEGYYALELFEKLPSKLVVPDSVTFTCILKVCSELCARAQGMTIHLEVVKLGLESDVIVGSTIVGMHANFGNLESAHNLFLKLPKPSLVSWNIILKGYAQSKDRHALLQLFERMQQQGVKPDDATFICVIKLCTGVGDARFGKIVYHQLIEFGFESDLQIGNSVIDMFIKAGCLEDGRIVFDKLANRDVVSWNTMLAGYVEHASAGSALAFFKAMQHGRIKANEFTYACVVKVCCNTGCINLGKFIHEQILQARIEVDLVLGNTLIDMYARCGSPEVAHVVLDDLFSPDALSWNALIAGYALCGNTSMMDRCLQDMESQGLKPNGGTLTSILAACSHGGQIRIGTRYFYSMQKDYCISPSIEHFNTMADLLCRIGCLKEAKSLLQTMPSCIDGSGWISLLAARRIYGNSEPCPLRT